MRKKNMRKLLTAGAGLVFCLHAYAAGGFSGVYTYKLVLRDDTGFALSGTETNAGDERVSANYTVEVYDDNGVKVNATLADTAIGRERGHNCTLSVPVGEGVGYAKSGERLTLVVTETYSGTERFRSSKVLPPVGGMFGFAASPAGVFYADAGDTDNGWDVWRTAVEYFLPDGLGEPGEDYDGDGLSNMREYQLGTDPAGGALGLVDVPGFSIVETDGVYKVSFNYVWGHVYSIRAIEGTAAVGVDGHDLELYEDLESLNGDSEWGTYFFDGGYNTGTKEFFVKKPQEGSFLIGLAVDGRLQEYIQVGAQSVAVTPGFPIEYGTESEALAAKAIAEIAPSVAVNAVLTGEGVADGYKAAFTVEVLQEGGKWLLSAELTPLAWTNLVDCATAATLQIPVAEIAMFPMEATTNVVLTGCMPGFYYSLCSGATVTNITADAEAMNLNVLCGADGVVEFPVVKKPEEGSGFFKVVTDVK